MAPTAECIIRTARAGDAPEVLLLARALATSYVVEEASFHSAFGAILNDRTRQLLVAAVGGRVVGYVQGLTHLAFHANGSVGWVEELLVAESSHGQGVARALMAAFEQWAAGSAEVRYVAVATRRAEGFYVALGYKSSATYLRKPVAVEPSDRVG